ncbi:MAG: tRNA (guanosine(37)-N1)-methyltransferase TrmD [Desulfovibrionaceae bacterium]
MRFTVVTIFPEFFDSPLGVGLLGKAVASGLVQVERVTPRTQAFDRHQTVDDKPYGGGPGLVMLPEPLGRTLESIDRPGRMLMLSPRGRRLDQAFARELAAEPDLTLICGRYEGIDERVLERFPIELVSVGDVVLNGGETGALAVIEAVSRLIPEFMHAGESLDEESFASGLLEYPHYTRPEVWEGLPAPEILRSGDHGRIAAWRREQALEQTLARRPDLLASARLDAADVAFLRSRPRRRLGRNLYLALVHWPARNKLGRTVTVSLTNLDIHDMSRVSRSYGLGGMFVCTPLEDQRRLARQVLEHWTAGPGRRANPDRAEALEGVDVTPTLDQAVLDIERRTGQKPRLVTTTADAAAASRSPEGGVGPGEVREWLRRGPVLLALGTGHGLAPEVLESAGALRPVRFLDEYNHLSVRCAAAILVDRLLADTD